MYINIFVDEDKEKNKYRIHLVPIYFTGGPVKFEVFTKDNIPIEITAFDELNINYNTPEGE